MATIGRRTGFAEAIPLLIVCVSGACATRSALEVGVLFGDSWTLGPVTLTADEQQRFKAAAFDELRTAYRDFKVDFAEDPNRDRIIRLDRNLMRSGSTQIGSKVSLVSLDGMNLTLLTIVGCRNINSCATYPRAALIEALGRGFGATAAHELGHQAGFRFVRDSKCDDCYDGASARHRSHFFGGKHWSPEATAMMRTVFSLRSR